MTADFNLNTVSSLFETTSRPDFNTVRTEIPHREDPLLTEIIQREGQIVQASQSMDLSSLESTLQRNGFTANTTVGVGKRKTRLPSGKNVTIWKDSANRKRICQDHATWKVNAFLLKGVKSQDEPHRWLNYTTNVKTCTSVLGNQDATFCGNSAGALVYLAPKHQAALVSAAPCDIVSPSETHAGNVGFYASARANTQGYCADQFKYSVAFDMVRNVKTSSIEFLEKIDEPQAKEAQRALQQKGVSVFDRKLYSLGTQDTNLEIEIDHIIQAIDLYPPLLNAINHSRQDFVDLKQKVHTYLQLPEVMQRSVQRVATTGWQLTNAADQDHPLLPKMRTTHQTLQAHGAKLANLGIVIPEIDSYPGVEELSPQQARGFIDTHAEQFQQQIQAHAVAGYTVTEAVSEKEARLKTALGHLDAIERQAQSALANFKAPKAQKKVRKFQAVVSQAKEPVSKLYTEIQMRSKKLRVSGFGIKKELLDDLATPRFAALHSEYQTKKEERKQNRAQLEQAEQELQILRNVQSTPLTEIQDKRTEVESLQLIATQLDSHIAQLQSDSTLATYRLINAANKRNFPCFVHGQ